MDARPARATRLVGAAQLVVALFGFVATSRRAPELVLGLSAMLAGWIAQKRMIRGLSMGALK